MGGPGAEALREAMGLTVGPADPAHAQTGVKGLVTSSAGAAIEGATVLALPMSGGGMMMPMGLHESDGLGPGSAKTGPDGVFQILGLDPAQRYRLQVRGPAPFLNTMSAAPTLKLDEVVSAGTFRLVMGATLSGIVVNAAGAPVAGATVRLGDPLPEGMMVMSGADMGHSGAGMTMAFTQIEFTEDEESADGEGAADGQAEADVRRPRMPAMPGVTRSATDGTFELTKVRPGAHKVSARKKGYGDAIQGGLKVAEGESRKDLRIELSAPGSLRVTVRDASGAPISGASVRAGSRFSMLGPRAAKGTPTDASGEARLTGLSETELTVEVLAAGYVRFQQTTRISAGGEGSLEATLLPGGAVYGRLIDGSTGDVLPLAFCQLVQEGENEQRRFDHGNMGSMQRGGEFRFEGLAPGVYRVEAEGGHLARTSFGPVTVGAGQVVDMGDCVLLEEGTLHVTVLDATTGEPIVGARVSKGSGGSMRVGMVSSSNVDVEVDEDGTTMVIGGGSDGRTGPDGRATLAGLSTGTIGILVEHAEHPSTPFEGIEVAAGEVREITVQLGKGGTIGGLARDSVGAMLAGAEVFLWSEGTARPQTTTTDETGRFTFTPVAAGTYRLSALAQGEQVLPEASGGDGFTLAEGQVIERDVVAPESASDLTFTVLDASGAPLAGAVIRLVAPFHAFGAEGTEQVADVAGRATFAGVAPFFDKVSVQWREGSEAREFSIVRAEGSSEQTLRLPENAPPGGLVGLVIQEGQGAAGAALRLKRTPSDPSDAVFERTDTTGPDGRFAFEEVPAGAYRLEITRAGNALEVRDFEVAREPWDLGSIQLFPVGFLVVIVKPPAGSAATEEVTIEATIQGDPSATRVRRVRFGERATFENLRAGAAYFLAVASPRSASPTLVSGTAAAELPEPIEIDLGQ
jgi:hypothetical protein